MKLTMLNKLLSPILACSLTMGAMLVTVSASSAQDAVQIEVAPVSESTLPPVPQSAIAPDSVLHNRAHHIALNANGGFTGQLLALDGSTNSVAGMSVMILRDGAVVTSAMTDAAGTFNVSGVGEGVVSVLGTGNNGLLLFSVRLMDEGNVFADATPVKLAAKTAQVAMNTAIVNGGDVAAIRQIIFGALPTGDYRFTSTLDETDHQYPYGTNETSTSLGHHTVQLQADGSLQGQVNVLDRRSGRHREINDLTLHFVKDGQHVGGTQVQADGRFHMAGLAPGRYSIATTGRDGILAMGIDIVGSLANVEKDGEFKLASIIESLELCVCPTQPSDFNTENAQRYNGGETQPTGEGEIVGTEMYGAPFGGPAGGPLGGAPSGVGGGVGGGGGGFGGGGGLGALLGAAAAGAIGYAVGQDDDPASPSR